MGHAFVTAVAMVVIGLFIPGFNDLFAGHIDEPKLVAQLHGSETSDKMPVGNCLKIPEVIL